jgi:hypothetical protein
MNDQAKTFDQILQAALQMGVVDIFKLIFWQVNATPADEIVQEIKAEILRLSPGRYSPSNPYRT